MRSGFQRGVRPARLERATYGSGGRRSIQLNYGRRKNLNVKRHQPGCNYQTTGDPVSPSACAVRDFSLQFDVVRLKMFARPAGGTEGVS